jgi:Bacterial toxin 44
MRELIHAQDVGHGHGYLRPSSRAVLTPQPVGIPELTDPARLRESAGARTPQVQLFHALPQTHGNQMVMRLMRRSDDMASRQERVPAQHKGEVDPPQGPNRTQSLRRICGPDVTQWLMDQMEINSKSKEVAAMNTSNAGAWFGKHSVYALLKWASLVRSGGKWDFKTQLGESVSGLTPCRQNCRGKLWSVTLDGQCMTYEAPANIHYGYVGRHAGFTEERLLGGAADAQVAEGRGETADDPRDVQAIKKGFALFNAGSPRGLMKSGLEKNYFQNLPPGDGDPQGCDPCPTKFS